MQLPAIRIPPLFKEYANLFTDSYIGVRIAVSNNPNRFLFQNYLWLYEGGPNAMYTNITDYKASKMNIFVDLFSSPNLDVRKAVANNFRATMFEEYTKFFMDPDSDIRNIVAENPRAKVYRLLMAIRRVVQIIYMTISETRLRSIKNIHSSSIITNHHLSEKPLQRILTLLCQRI